MTAIFGSLLTVCCGSFLTIFIFTITMLIQNSDNIGKSVKRSWYGVFRLNYGLYQSIIRQATTLIGLKMPIGGWFVFLSIMLSVGLCSIIILLFDLPTRIWVLVLAILHGLYVGLSSDKFTDPEGLQLGKRLQ